MIALEKTINTIQKNEKIEGSDKETVVTDVYEVHTPERMYEITLENGETIKCSGNHLWYAETNIDRENKEHYKKVAQMYFNDSPNLELLEKDIICSLDDVIKLMCTTDYHKDYILRVCNSIGNVAVDKTKWYTGENLTEYSHSTDLDLYSINDILKFIQKHGRALKGEEYFYFGQVYTTDILFNSFSPEEINIPTIFEVRNELKTDKKTS